MSIFWIDYETRSRADIRVVGAHRYAKHPSTEVMCMAYAVDEGEVKLWLPGQPQPEEMVQAIEEGWEIHAHNAQFERLITEHCMSRCGWRPVAFEQWRCTAAKAAHANQPRSLDGVTARLLPQELHKDKEGHKIMLKLSKPNRKGEFIYPEDEESIELYQRLYAYCKQDVRVERAIDARLPRWPDSEIKVWQLNEKINDRGVPIDRSLCEGAARLLEEKLAETSHNLGAATGGKITSGGQVQRIKEYLNKRGVNVDSLNAANVETLLNSGDILPPEVEEVLLLRQMTAGAAAKKYQSALDSVCEDDRIRGMFMYYGASMTGRFAGTRTQIHNMKKGADSTDCFRGIIASGDKGLADLLYGSSLVQELGKNVRNIVCAPPGYLLLREDSSQIECRVLHWLAGNEKMLQVFQEGADPYIAFATKVFKKEIRRGDPERAIGKAAVLGLGFGMGAARFAEQVWGQARIRIQAKFAKYVVDTYRSENKLVCQLWHNLEQAAYEVVTQSPGTIRRVGKLVLGCIGEGATRFLVMTLPSGRQLFYSQPAFIQEGRGRRFQYLSSRSLRCEWFGGVGVENGVQATSRDTLVHYMHNCERAGLKIVAHVHDEIMVLARKEKAEESHKLLAACFADKPAWANDLPTASDGKIDRRYN